MPKYAEIPGVQWLERHPTTGREIFGAPMLWEIPDAPAHDRFRVTTWEQACHMNYRDRKGWVLLAQAQLGDDGDWAPLFAQAAKNHPERAEEFKALVALCEENLAIHAAKIREKPPTKAEVELHKEERQAGIFGKAFGAKFAEVVAATKGKKRDEGAEGSEVEEQAGAKSVGAK